MPSTHGRTSSTDSSMATAITVNPVVAQLVVQCLPPGQVVATASPGRERVQQPFRPAPLRQRVGIAVEIGKRERRGNERGERIASRLGRERDRADPGRRRRSPTVATASSPPRRDRVARRRTGPSRSRTGTHTSSRQRPSGLSCHPSAAGRSAGSTRKVSPRRRSRRRADLVADDRDFGHVGGLTPQSIAIGTIAISRSHRGERDDGLAARAPLTVGCPRKVVEETERVARPARDQHRFRHRRRVACPSARVRAGPPLATDADGTPPAGTRARRRCTACRQGTPVAATGRPACGGAEWLRNQPGEADVHTGRAEPPAPDPTPRFRATCEVRPSVRGPDRRRTALRQARSPPPRPRTRRRPRPTVPVAAGPEPEPPTVEPTAVPETATATAAPPRPPAGDGSRTRPSRARRPGGTARASWWSACSSCCSAPGPDSWWVVRRPIPGRARSPMPPARRPRAICPSATCRSSSCSRTSASVPGTATPAGWVDCWVGCSAGRTVTPAP